MKTSWKTMLVAAVGTMWAVAGDAPDRTLTVVVYDYAGLSDSSMNEVESLTAVLLSRAGIQASGCTAWGINRVRGRLFATAIWTREPY